MLSVKGLEKSIVLLHGTIGPEGQNTVYYGYKGEKDKGINHKSGEWFFLLAGKYQ